MKLIYGKNISKSIWLQQTEIHYQLKTESSRKVKKFAKG